MPITSRRPGVISGRLGGLYERLSAAEFWLIHASCVAAGGMLILLFASRLRRELMPDPIEAVAVPYKNGSS